MTTPTPRDIELARAWLNNPVSAPPIDDNLRLQALAATYATARAEGEAAGAAREREAIAMICHNEAVNCNLNWEAAELLRDRTFWDYRATAFENMRDTIRARQGAPDAKPE